MCNLKQTVTIEMSQDELEEPQRYPRHFIFKPCFGLDLRNAVKTKVVFLDAMIALGLIIYIGIKLSLWKQQASTLQDSSQILLAFWGIYLANMMITFFFSILLFYSANSGDARKCKLWLFLATLLFGMWISIFFAHLTIFSRNLPITVTVLFCAFAIYRLYTLFVVHAFVREITFIGEDSNRNLTDQELVQFFHGNPIVAMHANSITIEAENKPYQQQFEICMDQLNLDTENPLENGQFSLVLKGNLKFSDGSSTLVAVKTIKPNANLAYFKAMLSEIKIMTYVFPEQHENVASVIGCCTSNIKNRSLTVINEFFPYGNLQQYLKKRRGFFVNLVKDGIICEDYAVKQYCNIESLNDDLITTYDQLRWSYEITQGLKYLASKGVVHADICAKNVYLSGEKIAKISNIGQARQLYYYSNYVKFEEMHWRWLALESLKDRNFSTQSDVWSLGATIWQIFSLGAIPFSGISWTSDFVGYLSRGLRMNKPCPATDDVYKLLLECWDNNPSQRPSLDTISNFFEKILRRYNILDCMTDMTKFRRTCYDSASTDSSFVQSPFGSLTTE